jgi:hypothetical protein
MARSCICAAVMIALVACPAAVAEFWSVPGSGLTDGISDNGVASGIGGSSYFYWTDGGGLQNIGGTVPGNGVGGQGKISNDGTRISGTYLNPASGFNEMSYYDIGAGAWNPLGGIGGMSGTEISSGWSITGDGQNVVGLGWIDAGTAHAIRGNLGGVVDLGSIVAGESSRANGVDFDGNVVCGWQDGAGRQGAVWVDGVETLIFTDTGDIAQEAFAVSNDGTWVTGYGIGGFFDPGYAYRYNTVTDSYESLPQLAVGAERLMAGAGITADGSTIVGGTWGFGPATGGRAFIWQEGIGTMAFADYLDSVGVAYPAGYTFNFVSDISSDGQWITGWGGTGPFASESWVVRIPEPMTGLILALGGLALLRRR